MPAWRRMEWTWTCRSAISHDPPQVVHYSVEEPLRVLAARQLPEQPGPQAAGLPDGLHREVGRAAAEAKVEVHVVARAPLTLDPAEVARHRELHDLELGSARAEANDEPRALAQLRRGLDRLAAWEPLGDVLGVREQLEHALDGRGDAGAEGDVEGGHGGVKLTAEGLVCTPRGCSSAGRAPGSHPGGQGFEPPQLHCRTVPLGVIGNTPDSGSGESWFEIGRAHV